MGKPAKTPSRAGEVLGGKYRLEQRLAIGGMGEVYRAINLAVERPVAIKLLRRELTHNEQVVKRFLREGKAANRVNHPNIARVLDIMRDGEQVFIVQDLLEGEDFQRVLKRAGKQLPADEVIDIVIPVAEALGEAHAAGLVHRDLKPANVFLTQVGNRRVPMVLDFGIAKVVTPDPEGDTPLTQTGTSMGTPAYMSPEQVMNPKNVDARADVWALGVMLHRAVAGKLPFKSDSPGGLMVTICTKPPEPLTEACPGVPEELAEVVACCLAREPEDRFANGTAVARALRGVQELVNEQISGFVLKDTLMSTPESAPSQNRRLPNLEIELPPSSQRNNSTPAPQSATRPRSRPSLEDAFAEAPTVLRTPTSQPQPSVRPAVPSMRPAVTSGPASVPPRSSRPSVPRQAPAPAPESLEINDGLHARPALLATLATVPALVLGWGFHGVEGIASLGQRIGGNAMALLTAAVIAGAVRSLMVVKGDGGRAAIPAFLGFAGTSAFAIVSTLAVLSESAPAEWVNLPGAISAAVAAGGVGVLGVLEAYAFLTKKPTNQNAGLLYGSLAFIAIGAALRLVL